MSLLLFGANGGTEIPPGDGGGGGGGGTGGGPGTPGSPGTPGGGGGGAPGIDVTEEIIEWVDARGIAWSLTEVGAAVHLDGKRGRFMPPIEYREDAMPDAPGSVLRNIRHAAREVVIPVGFQAGDRGLLRKQVRTWMRRLDPVRGDGKLRITAPNGDRRELICRCVDGPQGDESSDQRSDWSQKMVLVFRAQDPYWYDTVDIVRVVATGGSVGFFPLLPVHLSAGAVGAVSIIENDGDVEAYPVWTVQGPGTGVTIENQTTGDILDMPALSLTSGQVLTIDTRPRIKAVMREDGTNLRAQLTNASSLWPLVEGDNEVVVSVGGSTSATSSVVRFRRRWLTT